jgi:hypothetical protein
MPFHTFMHNKATVATQDMMVLQTADALIYTSNALLGRFYS